MISLSETPNSGLRNNLQRRKTVNAQTVNKSVKPERRYDIDWLRVLAVLLLFYVHPARIFYVWDDWYVKNDQLSLFLSRIAVFINHWHMPLFFILAGAATWFSLRRRSGGQYVKERFLRLLVPFIFGLLIIVPPQIYIGLQKDPSYAESYLAFYPSFFSYGDMGHLWFILYLFIFSLVALPLFLYLKCESGQRLTDGLAGFLTRPGMIFLPVILLIVADYLLLHFYPNPVYFFTFFAYGYIMMTNARVEKAIDRHKTVALILGLVLFVVWLSLVTLRLIGPDWLQPIPRSFITWFCLIALLGYGRQLLTSTNKFLNYFGEASYPVYILHQTVIVIIGFFVVQWGVGVLPKFVMIVVASFIVTIALYDLLVKRTNVTRFLFGMRPLKKKSAEAPTARPKAA
jgi:peptidoglycan/LPS O-acetylase OafA/YrhL